VPLEGVCVAKDTVVVRLVQRSGMTAPGGATGDGLNGDRRSFQRRSKIDAASVTDGSYVRGHTS
jgi:hypothetical protein